MLRSRKHRSAFSLMMVTGVVAVASVMSLAMLSTSTLQAEGVANQDKVLIADSLAESGINLGLYYLQNINDSSKAPSSLVLLGTGSSSYSQNNNTLGASVPGKFDLKFTHPSLTQYTVASTGKATTTSGTVNRSLTATVEVNYYGYGLNAPNTTSALTIPANTTITGGIYTGAAAAISGSVSGTTASSSNSGGTGVTQVFSTAAVNHYLTYNINGKSGTATLVTSGSYSNVTWGAVTGNPAGVYYCLGNLDLDGNCKITGTVIVASGGSLRFQGTGNSITPLRYFPAAVIEGDLKIKAASSTLDINGLTYVGGNISKSSSGSNYNLNILGTLLFAGTAPTIDSGVTLKVTYDRYKASVPSLTGATKPIPTSVSISNWKN